MEEMYKHDIFKVNSNMTHQSTEMCPCRVCSSNFLRLVVLSTLWPQRLGMGFCNLKNNDDESDLRLEPVPDTSGREVGVSSS